MSEEVVRPGLHPQVVNGMINFSNEEKSIVKKLGTEWYVTNCGDFWLGQSQIKSSKYRYVLIKPTTLYQEMFNLDREIAVVFSEYESFEPRTLDAIDHVLKEHQRLRIDKICSVIFSKDPDVEGKVKDLLKSEEEAQIIISISYLEFLSNKDDFFLRNKFKTNFYSRDLFSFEGPLKKDLYFFGRTELIHRLVSRHESGENSGLFGLRRSGKTSVIFGMSRALDSKESLSVVIDCHDPSFHMRRWNKALWYVIDQIVKAFNLNIKEADEDKYTEENASMLFKANISKAKNEKEKNILLIFDEIENITFDISPSQHWEKGLDFIYFWQTLRSCYQQLKGSFTFLLVGTNPTCAEQAKVGAKDNPLFLSIPLEYLEPFDIKQTREMVHKLGKTMGLRFDELIYGKLTEEYGGHPFLIRHVCSVMNRISTSTRPTDITRIAYSKAKEVFDQQYSAYIEMILSVLQEHYEEEYQMLVLLANGDIENFKSFASLSLYFTNHLIGYGLIEKCGEDYEFKIESVRKYLLNKNKFKKINMTPEEIMQEISVRRNSLEPNLRKIVRLQLMSAFGEGEAKNKVLAIMGLDEKKRTAYSAMAYKDLFDPNKVEIYFEDLRKLINKHWELFKNIFGPDKERFNESLKAINKYRGDAHAKDISGNEMSYVRVCFDFIEPMVSKLFD